jgi:hypothetical protein
MTIKKCTKKSRSTKQIILKGLPDVEGLFSAAGSVLIETATSGKTIGIPAMRLSLPSAATNLALLTTVTFSPNNGFRLSKMNNKNEK